jgi:ABC-type nitrate/sulfonate/bicarbonate transport system permease component
VADGRQPPSDSAAVRPRPPGRLRGDLSAAEAALWGFTTVAAVLAVWFLATAGRTGEERLVSPLILPSPGETLAEVPGLFGKGMLGDMLVTLRRVCLGFGLAALVGVPLGVLAACFPIVRAALGPVTIFGRNIPMAALIPLFFFLDALDGPMPTKALVAAQPGLAAWWSRAKASALGAQAIAEQAEGLKQMMASRA